MSPHTASTISVEPSGTAALYPTHLHRSTVERYVTIGQPIEKVIDFVAEVSCLGDRLSSAADPTFRQLRTYLGRQFEVRYTLYEIPGGTQITAVAQERSGSLGPVATLAARLARRRIDAELSGLKDHLE